jgi:quercetin dioxygenase-like cupin family protein
MAVTGYHLGPGAGDLVDLGGVGVHFKVRGERTGGAFAVVEHPVAPAVIVEPHAHRHEDELSFVLEGTLWARVGDEETELSAGSYLWKPRDVLHTFWNPGPEPARILETISPGGFEQFFEDLATLLQEDTPPAEDEVYGLCDRYGLTFDRSWLPGIEARFGPMRVV